MPSDLGLMQEFGLTELEIGTGSANRIRLAIGNRNQGQVAVYAGIDRKTLSRYLKGEVPKLRPLIAIAHLCGVSLEWLATGADEAIAMHSVQPIEPGGTSAVAMLDPPGQPGSRTERYVPIPRYNIQASAGGGALVEHAQVVEYLAFDVDFVRNRLRRDPKHLVLIEARGDSMEPTIRDGDILTIDVTPGQGLNNAGLYVLRVADNLLVKRLEQRLDGGVIVHSDNTRYGPETIARDQLATLSIVGEVLLVSAPPR